MLRGEKPREAPTYHQFRRDFAGPDTEVKPFENQMNNEHGTSAISVHGFNEIDARRLRGFLNVKKRRIQLGERMLRARKLSDNEIDPEGSSHSAPERRFERTKMIVTEKT